jgi:putative membrane protein
MVQKATFNPAVKSYIFMVPCFILLLSVVGIPILIVWLIGPGMAFAKRYYESLECELTETQLRYKKGVFVRVEKTIPLENIQDLTFVEGPILKAFRLSMLKIETAGSSGATKADMRLIGVDEAQNFRNAVLNQRDNMRKPSVTNEAKSQEILDVLVEIRDLLKSSKSE